MPYLFDLLFFTPQELEEELRDPYSFVSCNTAIGRVIYQMKKGRY